eukprot:CAMPEP_0117445918 /NCGR_PEP_ID=MMETSP0759-20121206/6056_1 /TAXON_ID=63605 /ORGANISM="Percolomonas cosmopolitus, Strain WS" /LENGTH=179 /DNA_ID=CAMNT_0005238135 /DNA_START=11 /DNA_END=550 /DNA_ORIENTATION=+
MNKRKRTNAPTPPSPTTHDKSLLKEYQQGPLSLLHSSTLSQSPILIQLRNNRKLIGTCRAFDYHMNLVLENVVEMWSEVVPAKNKNNAAENNTGQSTSKSHKINKSRNISKMFLRGDSIVLVVRDPAEKENERKRMELEKEREAREEGEGIEVNADKKDEGNTEKAEEQANDEDQQEEE